MFLSQIHTNFKGVTQINGIMNQFCKRTIFMEETSKRKLQMSRQAKQEKKKRYVRTKKYFLLIAATPFTDVQDRPSHNRAHPSTCFQTVWEQRALRHSCRPVFSLQTDSLSIFHDWGGWGKR